MSNKPKTQSKPLRGTKYPSPKAKAKPTQSFSVRKTEKQLKGNEAWYFLFVYIFGALVTTFTSSPTDFIYFLRMNSGKPLTPFEQVFYWYILLFIYYSVILFIIIIAFKSKRVNPSSIMYLLIGLSVTGGVLSVIVGKDLMFNSIVIATTVVTVVLESFMLIKVKQKERR